MASRSSLVKQPCVTCGEETAAGSVFFSDRTIIRSDDGISRYLCTLCDARIRTTRTHEPMTEDEVRRFVEVGSMTMIAWDRQ